MAIAFDRTTEAIAEATDPTNRHLDAGAKGRLHILDAVVTAAIVGRSSSAKSIGVSGDFPDTAGDRLRGGTALDWLLPRSRRARLRPDPTSFVFQITEPIGNFILEHVLLPLQTFLMEAPWFTTLAGLDADRARRLGLRPAITAFFMLALIGFVGVWAPAMDTLSQVLVATRIAVALGFGLGVWAAESRTVSGHLRPSTTSSRPCRSSSTSSRSST